MATAPRSSGTESVSAFREELSKLLPRDLPEDEVRSRVLALLAEGEPLPVYEVARRTECTSRDVLRALRLPEETSPEQTVRIRVEAETQAKPTVKRAPRPTRK